MSKMDEQMMWARVASALSKDLTAQQAEAAATRLRKLGAEYDGPAQRMLDNLATTTLTYVAERDKELDQDAESGGSSVSVVGHVEISMDTSFSVRLPFSEIETPDHNPIEVEVVATNGIAEVIFTEARADDEDGRGCVVWAGRPGKLFE